MLKGGRWYRKNIQGRGKSNNQYSYNTVNVQIVGDRVEEKSVQNFKHMHIMFHSSKISSGAASHTTLSLYLISIADFRFGFKPLHPSPNTPSFRSQTLAPHCYFTHDHGTDSEDSGPGRSS